MDSNIKAPLVSVLMPVYNSEKFLKEAIESILKQTFNDFEFLIINNCSTDKTLEIISLYNDDRIQLINKKENTGISNSLNLGIKIAKGKYIIRMDSDDISLPSRIEKQVQFLEQNKEYALCGSNYSIINSNHIVTLPESHSAIKTKLLENCCMAHPTVGFRKSFLKKNNLFYSQEMEPAEDYHFWTQLIQKGKFYNIQEQLLLYRFHDEQISTSKKLEQDKVSFDIKISYLKLLDKNLTIQEEYLLEKILLHIVKVQSDDIKLFGDFLLKIKRLNKATNYFERKNFNNYIDNLQFIFLNNYFSKYERYTILDFIKYLRIEKEHNIKFNLKNKINLFFKSIFFYKIKIKS